MASIPRNRSSLLSVPLRGPLTLFFVLLVIGTTVAAGWISYRVAYQSVEEEALAGLRASAAARDNGLTAAVARKRERVQSTLQSVVLGCGITGVMVRSCAAETLRPFLRAEHAYGAVLYYGKRQVLRLGSYNGDGVGSASGLPVVQPGPGNKPYVTVSHADRESGFTLAVDFSVAGLVSTTELLRTSTSVVSQIGEQEYVLGESGLIPADGRLLAGEFGACFAGNEGSALRQRRYMALRPSRALADTCVTAMRDEREIVAPVLRLKARIARVGMIFGLAALVLAYVMAWVLARPIMRLRQRVRELRKGDYESPVPIVGVGEVRELAYAFASMKDSVKAYRETVAENERRLAMVYKAARLWIWEYDLAYGEIISHEPAEKRVPHKTKLRAFLRRVHADDRHVVCDALRRAKVTGVYEVEYRIRRGDEEHVWMSSWGQVIGMLRRRMIGVSLDISSRKNAENLVREKDRLEASAEMAGSLAHEINNPLTAIMGAMYMLSQQRLGEPSSHYVDVAEQETRRVGHLVSQIVGLYQQPAARTAIEVRSLLEEVVANCRPDLEAKRQQVLLNSGRGVISGCREELVHAFSNILRNAIESCHSGADIHIRAHLARRWREANGFGVRVLIADPGPGIPAEQLPRVFDAFTGSKPQRGTGLGLWVARSAVTKHGGTIRIRAGQGERGGTVVTVFLPARSRGKGPKSAKTLPAATAGILG